MNRVEQIAKEISVLGPRLQRGLRVVSMASPKLTAPQLIVLLSIYEQGRVKAGKLGG